MRAWIAVAAALAMIPAFEARANCAMPVGYDVEEGPAGRVRICLRNFAERQCPDAGLLRRSTTRGEIVELTSCDGEGCFVDECVPAGTYEYGLAEPYACHSAACSTSYYEQVTVAGPAGACERTGPAPAAAAEVPWTSGQELVCTYGAGTGCGSAGTVVLGTNLAVLLAGLALWRARTDRRPRA